MLKQTVNCVTHNKLITAGGGSRYTAQLTEVRCDKGQDISGEESI